MEYQVVVRDGRKYVCTTGQDRLESEQDALDLVAACGENDTQLLMLMGDNLADDFFRLRTGLAGDVLQKFVNYYIRAVAVVPKDLASRGKFGEMATETNRGEQFGVFSTADEAEEWLLRPLGHAYKLPGRD